VEFKDFFSRPVEIYKNAWSVSGSLDVKFSPWRLWMQNPRISNRLNNFRNFRGKLHVKIVINGNAFYWGMAMMSYMPYTASAPFYYTDATWAGDKMTASQRQHIMIDPNLSQGGEMVLPFFWPEDCFDLVSGNPNDLGEMWLFSINVLQNATSSKAVDFHVYAWCEDVYLASPCQLPMQGLAAQAGEVKDEYAAGPISRPASVISSIAGKLTSVPGLGPFALASQIGANAVSNIAQLFGYCKPRQVNDPTRMVIGNAVELACIDSQDTAVTLGFTAKREVTLDPRTAGLSDVDELSFKHLASIESLFLDNVSWAQANNTGDALVSFPVNPYCQRILARPVPTSTAVHVLTPSAFVARPFNRWRGTMRVRIQIVANAFHKGRLLVSWDLGQPVLPTQPQVVRSQIIDLAECRDCSIDIGWGSFRPYLNAPDLFNNRYTYAGVFNTSSSFTDNGVVTITVLNELTSSQGSSEAIFINIWTSFPELEMMAPDSDGFNTFTPFPYDTTGLLESEPPDLKEDVLIAQTGQVEPLDGQTDINGPEGTDIIDTVGGSLPLATAAFAHGDPVTSFRSCLKRYCLEEVMQMDQAAGFEWAYVSKTRTMYPIYRGPLTGELDGDQWKGPLTLYAYVASAFAGWRGGIRYKFIPLSGGITINYWVNRQPAAARSNSGGTYNDGKALFAFEDESWSGMAMTNAATGRTLEVEMPWYGNRWADTFLSPATISQSLAYSVRAILPGNIATDLVRYVAVADDFNLFMFRGAPQISWWPDPPI
jgi:hypothetical protein